MILRSTEVKFKITEGKLSLLLKHNVIQDEKNSCEQLLCTCNNLAIKVIKILK